MSRVLLNEDSEGLRQIDLSGQDGNAFVLLGIAKQIGKQLVKENAFTKNTGFWTQDKLEDIQSEMKSDDYNNLVLTFEEHFGQFYHIYCSEEMLESLEDARVKRNELKAEKADTEAQAEMSLDNDKCSQNTNKRSPKR